MRRGSLSVADFRPDLIPYWLDKNDKPPSEVARGSGYKAWWIGPCGHEWQARVDNRCYNDAGCPFCTPSGGRRLLTGTNDLLTRFPDVAFEWHPTRNGNVTPNQVLPGTKQRFWWLCRDCGREWEAVVKFRTGKGSGCPSCRGRKRGLGNMGTAHCSRVVSEWSERNNLPLVKYSVASGHRAWWRCTKGHEWQAIIRDRNAKLTECKRCSMTGSSRMEDDLAEFVASLDCTIERHNRSISSAFEYDIVVPEKKFILEFNGLYWHSEDQKPGNDYHLRKTRAAESAGFRLIHVWEDDWRDRPEIVKRLIRRKLGVSQEDKYNARSLQLAHITSKQAKDFLENNHIQGYVSGSWCGGLFAQDELVALAVMKRRSSGDWELVRYATSGIVRGGFSKLVKYFQLEMHPHRLITFSDRGISSGELYLSSGFTCDGAIPPDYSYVVRGKRYHKFNYRKTRFKTDPELQYEDGLSERELARLNGIRRIYDVGKMRWVLTE